MRYESLMQAKFLSLGTYRKSREIVNTPIWFAELEGIYYAFSAGGAGKIKRLKNSSQSKVAACTSTGRVTGTWINASAWVLEKNEQTTALKALHQKYGWQMSMVDYLSKLTGKYNQRAYIAIQVKSSK